MKKLLLVLIAVLGFFPTYAQEGINQAAVVLDGMNQNLIIVDSDGRQTIIELPVPEDVFLNSSMMSISPDVNYAAFCWNVSGEASNTYHLSVLELETSNLIIDHDYGEITMCDASAFNTDGTQLAVSTVISSPAYDQTSEAVWALEVYDLASGTVIAELGRRDEISAAFTNLGDEVAVLADVRRFEGNVITFAAIPYVGMGGIADVPAFTWNLDDDSITSTEYVGKLSGDILFSASEIVFPALNSDYAAASPNGPLPQANEVRLYDGQQERVIYRNTEWVIVQARFIEDGESVAILLLENAGDGMPSEQRIDILTRDGRVIEMPQTYDNFAQIGNVEGAGIVLWAESTSSGTPISHLRMIRADGTAQDIWEYQAEVNERGFSFLELVWSQPLPDRVTYPEFPAVE